MKTVDEILDDFDPTDANAAVTIAEKYIKLRVEICALLEEYAEVRNGDLLASELRRLL